MTSVMSSEFLYLEFLYLEWCVVNVVDDWDLNLCLFTDLDIWKVIYVMLFR